jgi:hypothetical protein
MNLCDFLFRGRAHKKDSAESGGGVKLPIANLVFLGVLTLAALVYRIVARFSAAPL